MNSAEFLKNRPPLNPSNFDKFQQIRPIFYTLLGPTKICSAIYISWTSFYVLLMSFFSMQNNPTDIISESSDFETLNFKVVGSWFISNETHDSNSKSLI
jgi:hypothetical protein